MIRGEFIRGDGLVIPNNVTTFGARQVLVRAIQGDVEFDFFVALVAGVYTPELKVEDLVEPTINVNGYTRLALTQGVESWPTLGQVNGEWFVETVPLVWTPDGGDFDKAITRMALFTSNAGVTGEVFCLSNSLPDEMVIGVDTPEEDRTFRYRLYNH